MANNFADDWCKGRVNSRQNTQIITENICFNRTLKIAFNNHIARPTKKDGVLEIVWLFFDVVDSVTTIKQLSYDAFKFFLNKIRVYIRERC